MAQEAFDYQGLPGSPALSLSPPSCTHQLQLTESLKLLFFFSFILLKFFFQEIGFYNNFFCCVIQFLHCMMFSSFFFLTSLLEYNCFTLVCQFLLYNKVNRLYIYIYPHISSLLRLPPTLPIPPLQVVTKHRADLSVLCSCFPLAICFTFGSVYVFMPLSHFVPDYPSPSPCPQVHSLRLHLYSCPAPRFFRTFFFSFLGSKYTCQHTVFVFLFLTYFTLYDRLQVHPPHYK